MIRNLTPLLGGNNDDVVFPKNIYSLSDKVRQSGGNVETLIYDKTDHFSILGSLSIPYQQREPVLNDIIRFLDRNSRNFGDNYPGR